MTEELKNCAHCRQQPELKFWDAPIQSSGTGYLFYIKCACGLEYNGNYRFEYDSDCIAAWNRLASPWVSVEDGLPDYEVPVFIMSDGLVYTAVYRKGRILSDEFVLKFGGMDNDTLGEKPTNWMPIPPLPETK